MSVYSISDISVHDPEKYGEYVNQVRAIVESYGGRYQVRGGDITIRAGDWTPNRLVIIEFPSLDRLKEYVSSPEYPTVAEIRKSASEMISSVIVEGYDGENNSVRAT